MRRFVKSFIVKRVCQITVLHDSNTREFEVWRWAAESGLVRLTAFVYAAGSAFEGKEAAIKHARALYAASVPKCPWCDGFDGADPKHAGASHGMCAACQAREHAKLDALEARKGAPS